MRRVRLLTLAASTLLLAACDDATDTTSSSSSASSSSSSSSSGSSSSTSGSSSSSSSTGGGETCGDGIVDPGEACDDGNTATEACAYGETMCDVCDATCQLVAGETSTCGDGATDQAHEACDDANVVTEACLYGEASCVVCDDTCNAIPGATSTCGDGAIDAMHEGCDDGNAVTEACAYGDTSCTVCDDTCHDGAGVPSFCGDGATDAANGEACDDANTVTEVCAYGQASCVVCDDLCQEVPGAVSLCGDNVVQAAVEDCDDANAVTETCAYGQASCTVCDGTCHLGAGTTSVCGDGVVDAANGEDCDDGNVVTEKCAYGTASCTVCNATCKSVAGATTVCGDGVKDATNGEDCDDGNATANDGCEPSCHFVCGGGSGGSKAWLNSLGCFVRFDTALNWPSALGQCNAIGMSLATIHGATSNALVNAILGGATTYIGFNDIATEGAFAWASGDAVDYTNWNAGEPNNSGGNEDCTEMMTSGLWNDGQCATTRRYMCELETCGNGVVDANEACDDGNHVVESCPYGATSCGAVCGEACTSVNATTSYCGDGKIDATNLETCDDGNTATGDGCASCQAEPGWVCYPGTCVVGTEYAAGPGLGVPITDNTYDGTIGSMACANVSVTATGDGLVDSVAMRIGLTHTYAGDLTIKVISPDGTTVTVLSLPGTSESADNGSGSGSADANLSAGAPILFVDGATADAEQMDGGLSSSQTICLDNGVCTYKPNKGSATGGTLSSFAGVSADGTWQVCVGDSAGADVGTVDRVSLVILQ